MKTNKILQNKNVKIFLAYTLLHLALGLFILYFFMSQDRTLIYHSDAWRQHIKALTYYSKWLRGVFYHIFVEHQFNIQTYTLGIGYGSDVVTTLQYYCLGDPLTFLSALVPTGGIVWYFQALVLLRPYLAGLSFLAWLLYKKEDRVGALAAIMGAATYAFSGMYFYIGMLHPYFINPMIYLPLLFLGIEIILRGKKYAFFTLMVALSCLCNFYFFYMLAIFTAAYGIVRLMMESGRDASHRECAGDGGQAAGTPLAAVPEESSQVPQGTPAAADAHQDKNSIARKLTYILKGGLPMLGHAIVGVMMAAVTLIPVLYQFRQDPRAATGYGIPLFYRSDYYRELLAGFITNINHPLYDAELGFTGLALVLVFVLFAKKGHAYLKAAFLGLTLMLLIPAAGYAMNGFAYLIDRWTWCYALMMGYLVAVILPETTDLSRKEKKILCVLWAVYTVLLNLFAPKGLNLVLSFVTTIPAMVIILLAGKSNGTRSAVPATEAAEQALARDSSADGETVLARETSKTHIRPTTLLALLLVLGILINIFCGDSALMLNLPEEMMEHMTPAQYEAALNATEVGAVDSLGGRDAFYRYTGRNLTWNAAMNTGISSTQFCFSFANGAVSDYFQAIGINDEQNFAYYALDDRMIPNMLAGVRYYTLAYDNGFEYQFVPYGFADLGMVGDYHAFQSDFALPLGYTYEGTIDPAAFEQMTMNQRQEALLFGVVPEKTSDAFSAYPDKTGTAQAAFTDHELDYEVITDSAVTYDNNTFTVSGAGATAELVFDGDAFAETYITFDNLQVTSPFDGIDIYELIFNAFEGENSATQKSIKYQAASSQYYSGWNDFALNMGFSAGTRTRIIITFPCPGTYSFDKMSIVCQEPGIMEQGLQLALEPMTGVDLHKNPLSYATNEITGEVTVSSDKILLLNLPYSEGWSAEVDGVRTSLDKANVMYMALPLKAGSHTVRLTYRTPGGHLSILLSLVGIALFVFLLYKERNKERRHS